MDSAAIIKALSLHLIILFAITKISICSAVTPATVESAIKPLSTDNGTNFSCLNRTFDMYFPNIDTGCRTFHLCTKIEGDAVLNLSFMCPEGTSFDFRSADCQNSETVTCKPENGGTRAARKVSKNFKNKLQLAQPKTSFKCQGKKLGKYYADVETNCTTFHLCTMGEFKSEILDFQFMCLEGTLFDEQWLQCRPESLTSCGQRQVHVPQSKAPPKNIPNEFLKESHKQPSQATPVQDSKSKFLDSKEPTIRLQDAPPTTASSDYLNDFNITETDYDYYEDPLALPIREKRNAIPVKIQKLLPVNSEHIRVKRAPPPNLNMEALPATSFSCADKIPGGYYADVETGCQLYHVCAPGPDGAMRSTKFLCGNNTIFSQQTRTCQIWYTVDCESTPQFFTLNEELSRVLPEDSIGGSTLSEPLAPPEITQQQAIRQSSAIFDNVPSRRPVQSRDSRPFQAPPEAEQGFDIFINRPLSHESQPGFMQQSLPAVEDTSRPELDSRLQQLAEEQRAQDAARDNAATRPSRRRKQKRRRKQRPRPSPQADDVAVEFQHDNLGASIPVTRDPFEDSGVLGHSATPSPFPGSVFDFNSHSTSNQQITEPQQFHIPDHVPGLLEEIQVRGRFRQTEDDLIREAGQSPRRNTQLPVRLQQQESIEVSVPTSQRIVSSSRDLLPQSISAIETQAGQQALPQTSQQSQTEGAIFEGFDAFIQSAIQQEHEQRANLGPILEHRRRQEEAENQRKQQEQQRKATRRRKQPRTTTARPHVPQPSNGQQLQESQLIFPQIAENEPHLTGIHFPEFPRRSQLSNQQLTLNNLQGQTSLFQIPLSQQETRPPQPFVHQRPNVQSVPATQQTANFNGLIFQQFPQRSQQLPQHQTSSIRDFVFLLPAESELFPSTLIQPQLATGATLQTQNHGQQKQENPLTQKQGENQFLGFIPKVPEPKEGQSQLLRFDSVNSTGFEIRTRFTRQASHEFLMKTNATDELYPTTSFTCKEKLLGSYYADIHTNCEMFHICTYGRKKGLLYDFRFWCTNGTAFDQRSQTCKVSAEVNCSTTRKYYPNYSTTKKFPIPVPNANPMKIRIKRAVKNVIAIVARNLTTSSFACSGRDANRYYADAETNCQMFHLCAENGPGGRLVDYPFLCRNGTVFDQRSQACNDQTDALNCQDDPPHYGIGKDFGRF